ncbi:maleylpyruvate isomerase N-terminal domain-containing protein [Streptomyces sp. NPDC046853]|uniref:maleylpyruvate isomerase N-terminal domain-containing protein n=1 Tax=Streptomyces sp. NPDC046853 TaxID=3154920 RepID=UPI0033D066B6
MTTDHEAVRDLLGAWAVGALMPGDERTLAPHLADCDPCAAEAARLRAVVRDLDGPPVTTGPAPAGRGLALALRTRPAASRTASHAAPYAAAVAGLQALLGELDERGSWGVPVVHDWDAHDTVAHLLAADEPLAVRLGLRVPGEFDGVDGTSWREAWAARTEEVLARERGRAPAETVVSWRNQANALLSSPEARDPELAGRATTLMGARLPLADHFLVRAFEAWVHTEDIGGALDLPVPPPRTAHLWQLVRLAVRILGLALGPATPAVALTVAGDGGEVSWILGDGAEPVSAELVLDPVDFCLLMGGRVDPAGVPRGLSGDESAAAHVLTRAASLAWL